MYRHDLLRAHAAAAQLNNIDIEKLTGVSRTTIGKIMNGDESGRFELHRLHSIARALKIPWPKLFEPPPVVDQAAILPSVSESV